MRVRIPTYRSGQQVKRGFYWNVKAWEAHTVPSGGGVLEGAPNEAFVRVPLVVVLLLAPMMGAVYAIFLPFVGFAMVAMYLGGMLKRRSPRTPPAAETREELRKAA